MIHLMPKSIPAIMRGLWRRMLVAAAVRADDADRALLSTFCDAADIKGSACTRAKGYPNAGTAAATSSYQRIATAPVYRGRQSAAGGHYESGCEAHATDNGGAAVFEQSDGKTIFRGFAPGSHANDCRHREERAAGLAGLPHRHIGQGILEGGVAQMALTQDYSKDISISADFPPHRRKFHRRLWRQCRHLQGTLEIFRGLGHQAGTRPQTVSVKASYADAGTIKKACAKGFPSRSKFRQALAGRRLCARRLREARHFIIDLVTRKVTGQ